METQNILVEFGLTPIEAKVYLALLKTGMSQAGRIAKEAQLNRTTTYDALSRLIDKGLVSYGMEANKKVFRPGNPSKFKEILKEREHEIDDVLPRLNMLFGNVATKKAVTSYYGKKGVQSVFEDMVRHAKELFVIDAGAQFTQTLPLYLPHFTREIERLKIPIKHIARRGVDIKPTKTTEIRYIPKQVLTTAGMTLYADRVAITIWTDPPEAVIIRNKAVYESFKNYFDILWKSAKP